MCPQVVHPHRSGKLSLPQVIVAEAALTQQCFGTSPVHTTPSFSYNRFAQLKHTYNYVHTRVLIQVTNVNNLSIHTYTCTDCRLSDIFLCSLPQFSLNVPIAVH
ncbi:unnamed protein product [Hymenolepis diminuta]|uniref:Uncharacterized protein n=1 Tax=Hymenolepis diminuta TaxID=6216 RepID=A0A564YKS7_HYMDI|nr:unnamed protein product [Hymenolepis diminuta]